MTTIEPRNPNGSDDAALALCMFDAIHQGTSLYTAEQRQAWMPEHYGGRDWTDRLNGQYVVLARRDGGVVGFMSLAKGYVDLAFVAASHQGQGIFGRLFAALQEHALEAGVRRLTTHASLMAQPAFMAVGFHVIRHEEVAQRGQMLPRAEMEKRLMTPEEIAKLPYRPCVGVMLLNAKGHVFVGQRNDRYRDAWQMPQGGVDKGEAPRDAALRELEEETGVSRDLVTIVAETAGWVPYELPYDLVPQLWKGRYRGQEQKWFLMQFQGTDDQVNIETEHPEFSHWKWMPVTELVDSIVPFKRDVYRSVLAEFEPHL